MAALNIGELPILLISDLEIQEGIERLKQAGSEYFQCLARRGVNTKTIHQMNLAFSSVMALMMSLLNAEFQKSASRLSPALMNQTFIATHTVSFEDYPSVITPPEDAEVVAGGLPNSEVTVLFDNYNQRRKHVQTFLLNMALAYDYAELETEFRNQIMEWSTTVRAVASLITQNHKTAIANYVCSNWIQRRQCVSVDIFKGRDIWVPLIDAVFVNNTLEEKNRLVEFFRRAITQHNNKVKPILMLNVSVHDRYCRCHQAPPS